MIVVRITPRLFAQAVLENVCGAPEMVTDAICAKFNEWLAIGNNRKEDYSPSEIESASGFIMGR